VAWNGPTLETGCVMARPHSPVIFCTAEKQDKNILSVFDQSYTFAQPVLTGT